MDAYINANDVPVNKRRKNQNSLLFLLQSSFPAFLRTKKLFKNYKN